MFPQLVKKVHYRACKSPYYSLSSDISITRTVRILRFFVGFILILSSHLWLGLKGVFKSLCALSSLICPARLSRPDNIQLDVQNIKLLLVNLSPFS
jgi:hypothetical protein